jgi:hypothetical protein
MRALGEPDAFPSSDLGLMRALSLTNPREVERRAEPWRPWRAYAAMYLWRMAARSQQKDKQTLARPSSRKRALDIAGQMDLTRKPSIRGFAQG